MILCIIIILLATFCSCANQANNTGGTSNVISPNNAGNTSDTLQNTLKEQFSKIQSTEFALFFFQNLWQNYFGLGSGSIPPAQSKDILIKKLKSNEIDIAIIESYNNETSFDENLKYVLIGIDATIFSTSINNPVKYITLKQLSDIYVSKNIKNWNQLGGKSGEILLPEYSYTTSKIRLQNLFPENQGDLFNISQNDLYSRIDFNFDISISGYSLNDDYTLLCDSACSEVYFNLHPDQYKHILEEKVIFIDNITPTINNILMGEYPYLTYTYAVVKKTRCDELNIKQMIEWLCYNEDVSLYKIINGIGILDESNDLNFDLLT